MLLFNLFIIGNILGVSEVNFLEQNIIDDIKFYPEQDFKVEGFYYHPEYYRPDVLAEVHSISEIFNLNTDEIQTDNNLKKVIVYNENIELQLVFEENYDIVQKIRYIDYEKDLDVKTGVSVEDDNRDKLNEEQFAFSIFMTEARQLNNQVYIPLFNLGLIFDYETTVELEELESGKKKITSISIENKGYIQERIDNKINELNEEYSFLTEDDLPSIKMELRYENNRIEKAINYFNEHNNITDEEIRKMFVGDIWFGMTKEQFKIIKGEPNQVNITYHTKDNLHEQWVYGRTNRRFYYFENGILTTIQRL